MGVTPAPDSGGLRRTLGLTDAITIGLGSMVGAGIFAVWGPAAQSAGRLVLVALLVAAVVAACNALSSAALAARYPSAGGTYVYGRERLGPFWGYLAGWCFVVGKTASCAAMAMVVGSYLVPDAARIAAVVAVVLVTGLNLLGVRRSVAASKVIVAVVVCALLGVAVAAVWPGPGTAWQASALWAADGSAAAPAELLGVLQAAGLIFFAFAGYARIATLGEEVAEPEKVIPRAIGIALASVLVLYIMVAVVVLGVLGAAGTAQAPAPLAEVATQVWGGRLAWVIRGVAGLAALGALLNLVLGISRTALAMARDGHLPRVVATVAGADRVPRVAELLVGAGVVVVVLVADLRGMIGFSSFGVLLYYAVANASAFTLRREWVPGRTVPVVGLVGCVVLAACLPVTSVLGGMLLVGLGVVVYLVRHPSKTTGIGA